MGVAGCAWRDGEYLMILVQCICTKHIMKLGQNPFDCVTVVVRSLGKHRGPVGSRYSRQVEMKDMIMLVDP